MFYVVKIPVIRGFQDKTCVYDIVIQYETHNLEHGITEPLDMEELLAVLEEEDQLTYLCNEFDFVNKRMDDYSDAQWNASIRIRLWDLKPEDICPESQWNYFTSP